MKKILFALTMLAFAVSALPQARADDVSIDFIYDNLSGGNWIEAGGYGYGWQPDVAVSDPNWRPYADGYWAYTDYGWTWISYEDFGWATYHYGRWANLADYGWVWFPGSDLEWGPAWVSWRTGGDYIGWAPLPPRGPGVVYEGQPIGANVDIAFDIGPEYYNFCDLRFVGEPVLRDRIFPRAQNVTYITNTVNVTNITVQNNIVYNHGPNYNIVNQYSSRPIQRLTIERETPSNLSASLKSGTLTKVQGNKLLVAAPQNFAKAPPASKPPAVKARVEQPKIQHGWKGVPNEAELKEKIKNQNPKNILPPTRAAAREAGPPALVPGTSPAGANGGAATSPGPRGKRGRVLPGATVVPSLGASASPGRGRAKPGERSPEAGPEGGATGAAKATPASRFQGGPAPSEHGRTPGRKSGEEPGAGQGGAGRFRRRGMPGNLNANDSARLSLPARVNTRNVAGERHLDFINQWFRQVAEDLRTKRGINERECRALTLNSRHHNELERPQQPSMARHRDNRKVERENQKKEHRRQGHNKFTRNYSQRLRMKIPEPVFCGGSRASCTCDNDAGDTPAS